MNVPDSRAYFIFVQRSLELNGDDMSLAGADWLKNQTMEFQGSTSRLSPEEYQPIRMRE